MAYGVIYKIKSWDCNRKSITCEETGEIFNSVVEASKKIGISIRQLARILKTNNISNKYKLTFRFLNKYGANNL